MDEWDAQKMLDLYIHDYLVRKNLHTTADILAKEANIQPKAVVINPPDGFLAEWWSIFWDMYTARMNSQVDQVSTSNPIPNASQVPQNPVSQVPQNPLSQVPDVNYMLQSMSPPMPRLDMPNMLQTINPTFVPMSEMGGSMHNTFPPMMPNVGFGPYFGPSRFGLTPISDNMRQDQAMVDLVAPKVSIKEGLGLPPKKPDPSLNVLNAACLLPSGARMLPSGSGYPIKNTYNKRPLPVTKELNIGGGSRSTTPELPLHAPKLIQDDAENADTGKKILNQIPSDGCSLTGFGYVDNFPASNQPNQFPAMPTAYQIETTPDLAAQASKKLIISAPESSSQMASPLLLDNDSSMGKGLQFVKSTELADLMDADIDAFFANDDQPPEDMSTSLSQTLPQSSSVGKPQQQDISFQPVSSLHPTNNKLSCCDFSGHGKFLAAAGHEKKVFVWNLKQWNRQTIQAHSQLITDIRFKPSSFVFATSSFDRTVKIWDASNPRKAAVNLVGHSGQVMSVDFHPRKPNLLCSCDCNDEIRVWNFRDSTCSRTLKGANRQVRFQPRHGNLMAAAIGNIIYMIDVETGTIERRFEGHEKDVRSLSWDICGDYLASVSEDSARIWSLVSAGEKSIHVLHSCGADFASCTYHPAYTQVVAVGSYQSVCIWNPAMGHRTWNYPAHEGIISAMANSPETNMIASASHDQWIKLWK